MSSQGYFQFFPLSPAAISVNAIFLGAGRYPSKNGWKHVFYTAVLGTPDFVSGKASYRLIPKSITIPSVQQSLRASRPYSRSCWDDHGNQSSAGCCRNAK
jgi:hypothetical protein